MLDLCAALWENAGAADRKQLQDAARGEAVFPVVEDGEGHVTRVALNEEIAFYPPRSSTAELPLRNIRFLGIHFAGAPSGTATSAPFSESR